jgi:hypothetical protein
MNCFSADVFYHSLDLARFIISGIRKFVVTCDCSQYRS